ncbi:uncharacterized protein Jarid2 isoform X1 [Euwallacea fornicatus]|uniref:uncharacterized protein Jarid2 isoform X1 n=2 Tax=Euwallacea fornicatus TaxID=995702 RepID=UPI00338E01DA
MKRKRKDVCTSPSLCDSPKRTKIQAQRKFAQNSGINSSIMTPIRDLDISDDAQTSTLPEPVELLPMKRPNTEDFLTFLCFRGTPILPPTLQFFNTASIVADGQVHEIKSDCPKNGPIDISKCGSGSSSEKPFIAFGVRKRADPIIISRQMERKRRHALALQALRRKYQEQKMAKIRALTISKLSEKTTNRTLVKTNTVQKTETSVTKKSSTKVIATKHVKVTTQTLKTKVKPKMCLRSFRGKFIQKELPFRPKRPLGERVLTNVGRTSKNSNKSEEGALAIKRPVKKPLAQTPKTKLTTASVVRSSTVTSVKRQQIKRRILVPSSSVVTTVVKPKLRSTTMKKTVISRKKAQQRLRPCVSKVANPSKEPCKKVAIKKSPLEESTLKPNQSSQEDGRSHPGEEVSRRLTRRDSEMLNSKTLPSGRLKREMKKKFEVKREVNIAESSSRRVVKKNLDVKRDFSLKTRNRDVKKSMALHKTSDTIMETLQSGQKITMDQKTSEMTSVQRVVTRKSEESIRIPNVPPVKAELKRTSRSVTKAAEPIAKKAVARPDSPKRRPAVNRESKLETEQNSSRRLTRDYSAKLADTSTDTKEVVKKEEKDILEQNAQFQTKPTVRKEKEEVVNLRSTTTEVIVPTSNKDNICEHPPIVSIEAKGMENLADPEIVVQKPIIEPKRTPTKKPPKRSCEAVPQVPIRPSRKTKEAAAIYMEILSHKLVNDSTIDDDNVSIDSFPELPNVKRTEQREIELKAHAKTSKEDEENKNSDALRRSVEPKNTTVISDDDSDNEVLQAKIAKAAKEIPAKPKEEIINNCDSSDQSVDVKNSRKKKATAKRSKCGSSVLETNVDIILEAARVLEETKPKETSDDESSASDINLKSLQAKQRKKLNESKAAIFSDSDEEPLAKLTTKIHKPETTIKLRRTADKQLSNAATIMEPKPKRECAKRPSYYLPMMSSSDEDEEPYFHGFSAPKEELKKVQALAPSLDLLSKDLGRKEKVNMSNEQIEQWLKDSAMAGSSVAKENDAMLKFGEKIPTESLKLEVASSLKLKIEEAQPGSGKEISCDEKVKAELKSPSSDRKWIFKKDKKEPMPPNKNAFSPENECSVYAFGEDNEDAVNTPFRRPSRRPSSTATSRSEDDMSKTDEASKQAQFRKPVPSDSEDSRCFNVPQNPAKPSKLVKSEGMVPPSSGNYPVKRTGKSNLEPFDDTKYKVPSSPSASSSSSAKLSKKGTQKPKTPNKGWECVNPVYVNDFPKPTDPAKLVEAPVFHPTEQEFQDPLEYIERIRHKAEQFGICKIVPPSSFKPECKVSDDMRFTAYNQYVHKMLHRWGPNFKEFVAIRKYLATQSIFLKTPPLIGGMEIDLPRLYQTVQNLGGLKEVIEKKRWPKVSEYMKIPKSAQDRVTKLDDIYCKYLLPYDTLSPAEREKLFEEVEAYWSKKQSPTQPDTTSSEQDSVDSDDNDVDNECTIKGKNMALSALYRIARNTMSMYFKVLEPSATEVEQEFWRYVTQKRNHICVHSASIDCGTWGYGFAVAKNSPFAKHPWNLKVLSNNGGSVLRSLGPVMGVTVPTLHVGMVFSACCWYRDPHGLPWVEYLHTGGTKIWYGIPSTSCALFRAAMRKLVPGYCREKELWLPSDTAMVPPEMLLEHQVSLCRTVQEPGQFVVVFPKVYTSGIGTGYVVSESVYFAPLYWLRTARALFDDLKTSCEPSMFSLEKLFVSIAGDARSSVEVLKTVLPFVEELCANERDYRAKLRLLGAIAEEKIIDSDSHSKKRKIQSVDGDLECEMCRTNLYVSMLVDMRDELIYCLEHALQLPESDLKAAERFKLRYHLVDSELEGIPQRIKAAIEGKVQKKPPPGKYAGLPTLLK